MGTFLKADAADVLAPKGRGKVSCVARTMSSAICQRLLLWGRSASVGSSGIGWSGKGKGHQVSKLHGRVKSVAPVEGPSKSNTSLQRANPTYRPFPDPRPAVN